MSAGLLDLDKGKTVLNFYSKPIPTKPIIFQNEITFMIIIENYFNMSFNFTKLVKHILKILQCEHCKIFKVKVFDHFFTLWMKGLMIKFS